MRIRIGPPDGTPVLSLPTRPLRDLVDRALKEAEGARRRRGGSLAAWVAVDPLEAGTP